MLENFKKQCPLSSDELEFFTLEACERLRNDMAAFEAAVRSYWFYTNDNAIEDKEFDKLPAELLELWAAICMFGEDNSGKVDILAEPAQFNEFIQKLKEALL